MQVFGKGYHNARMEEGAVLAGIGKGTIYNTSPVNCSCFRRPENSVELYYDSIVFEEVPFFLLRKAAPAD